MYQICDIDGLIKISPYAVICLFCAFIGLLVTGTAYTSIYELRQIYSGA